MSRYQTLALGHTLDDRSELIAALAELGIAVEHAEFEGDELMLRGSLECAGEPVALRVAAGTLGSVEDFGLALAQGRWQLICGEVDRRLLERRLIDPLGPALGLVRARRAAAIAGLRVEASVEPDGTRRVRLTPNR